jgi:hypothetical protein
MVPAKCWVGLRVRRRIRSAPLSCVLPILLALAFLGTAGAQGPSSSTGPISSPPLQPLRQLNPFGGPGSALFPPGSDVVPISSGLLAPFLPVIPNLEFGFLYTWDSSLKINTGRVTADYLLPFSLRCDSSLFVEAHAESEFQEFLGGQRRVTTAGQGFVTTTTATNNRTDLSFGGGYRRLLGGGRTLLGINGFYDTTRLWGKWYSSGGVGLELLCNVTPQDAVDLRANWYGNLFSRDLFVNAFRNKGGSADIEAGYNRALFYEALDLRLKFTGYQFDIGEDPVYGYRAGAELATRDGVLTARYEHGYDRVNGQYDTIGGYVTLGFYLDSVLAGEIPFSMPEPVFVNPRNLRRWLSQKVRRNWHQPTAVVLTRTGFTGGGGAIACDRTLSAVSTGGGGGFFTGNASFPAFPRTSLDPTKFIKVEFDYAFNVAPAGGVADWTVQVYGPFPAFTAFDEFTSSTVPTGQSGHMTFKLDTHGFPIPGQNAFIVAGLDPDGIGFVVNAPGTFILTITNVCIRFNQ